MAIMNLEDFVIILDNWGLTDVLLPLLLIFTLIFAILQKTEVLGERKKNMNVGVALVIGLMVVIPHVLHVYPSEWSDPVEIMNKALPTVSLIVVAILALLILIGIFGGEIKYFGVSFAGWIAIGSVVMIVLIFGSAAGWWGWGRNFWWWLNNFFGSDTIALIIIILVFGIIINFITRGEKDAEERTAVSKLGDNLKKIFEPGSK